MFDFTSMSRFSGIYWVCGRFEGLSMFNLQIVLPSLFVARYLMSAHVEETRVKQDTRVIWEIAIFIE